MRQDKVRRIRSNATWFSLGECGTFKGNTTVEWNVFFTNVDKNRANTVECGRMRQDAVGFVRYYRVEYSTSLRLNANEFNGFGNYESD